MAGGPTAYLRTARACLGPDDATTGLLAAMDTALSVADPVVVTAEAVENVAAVSRADA